MNARRAGERLASKLVMRPTAAVLLFVLLLAPVASAQGTGASQARTVPTPVEVAAQASLDTGSLLAVYMGQLAAAGTPPSQADIDQAARLYFTNGAAVTSVPTTGPRAAYFTNGAAVMAVPSSGPGAAYFHNGAAVMAYSPAPAFSRAREPTAGADAGTVGNARSPEDASTPSALPGPEQPVAPVGTAASQPIAAPPTGPSTATGPTCSPLEIEAAMAIARQFALAAAPAPAAPSSSPVPVPSPGPQLAELASASISEFAPRGPAAPAVVPHLAAAGLGGALFGGFVVALWLRSRSRRVVQRLR
jgi:hypothetical protein